MAGYSGVPDTALLLPAAEQGPKYSHSSSLDSGGAVIPTLCKPLKDLQEKFNVRAIEGPAGEL
jgi:hypothetical protein